MNIFFDTRNGNVRVDSLWLSSLLADGAGKDAAFTGSLAILSPVSGGPQNTLTVTAVSSGTIYPGTKLVGAGVAAGTIITGQILNGPSPVQPGGIGTYTVNIGQNVSSEAMTSTALADLTAGSMALSGNATVAGETITQSFELDTGTKTAAATAGAATLNKNSGVITSEALTTAAGATYSLNITDSAAAAGDFAFASVSNGTNSAGVPTIASVTVTAGHIVVVVQNIHASAAFNGTIKIAFALLKA